MSRCLLVACIRRFPWRRISAFSAVALFCLGTIVLSHVARKSPTLASETLNAFELPKSIYPEPFSPSPVVISVPGTVQIQGVNLYAPGIPLETGTEGLSKLSLIDMRASRL